MRYLLFLISLLFAQEQISPTTSYFSPSLNPHSPPLLQCTPLLIQIIKSSDYEFEQWSERGEDRAYIQAHTSFFFDTWNEKEILVKLFLNYSSPTQGSGLMTWIKYNPQNGELIDFIAEKPLSYDKTLNSLFQSCLQQHSKED